MAIMYISRISITNYRCFDDFDLILDATTQNALVLVGETQSGKTNLLHALRLLLDADATKLLNQLEQQDFRNLEKAIEISVEITTKLDHPLAHIIFDCFLSQDPDQCTYIGKIGLQIEWKDAKIKWGYYQGKKPEAFMKSLGLKSSLELGYLAPLRDVEAELRNKSISPLRWRLNRITQAPTEYENAAAQLQQIVNVELQELNTDITSKTDQLVGKRHSLKYQLKAVELDYTQALTEAKLGFTLGHNNNTLGLVSNSLGLNNALYITLKKLTFTDNEFKKPSQFLNSNDENSTDIMTWLAIEEPEAHLHPQLQRQVFDQLTKDPQPLFATIVSTHSPHLVSVTDPRHVVLLKKTPQGTQAKRFTGFDKNSEVKLAKLKNYLHATRAEMFFAAGVVLVEGIAEKNMIHAWYPDLDALGISVCCIDGVDFEVYTEFLDQLELPYVVITDYDPKKMTKKNTCETSNSYLKNLAPNPKDVFFNKCTFEYELLKLEAYQALVKNHAKKEHPQKGEVNYQACIKACPYTFKKAWEKLNLRKGSLSRELSAKLCPFDVSQSTNRGMSCDIRLAYCDKYIPNYVQNAIDAYVASDIQYAIGIRADYSAYQDKYIPSYIQKAIKKIAEDVC